MSEQEYVTTIERYLSFLKKCTDLRQQLVYRIQIIDLFEKMAKNCMVNLM